MQAQPQRQTHTHRTPTWQRSAARGTRSVGSSLRCRRTQCFCIAPTTRWYVSPTTARTRASHAAVTASATAVHAPLVLGRLSGRPTRICARLRALFRKPSRGPLSQRRQLVPVRRRPPHRSFSRPAHRHTPAPHTYLSCVVECSCLGQRSVSLRDLCRGPGGRAALPTCPPLPLSHSHTSR